MWEAALLCLCNSAAVQPMQVGWCAYKVTQTLSKCSGQRWGKARKKIKRKYRVIKWYGITLWWKLRPWKACEITGRCAGVKWHKEFLWEVWSKFLQPHCNFNEKNYLCQILTAVRKVVSLFWRAELPQITEENESRQEGRNVVLLEAVLPRNVIYIYIYIIQRTKAVCVHKQE